MGGDNKKAILYRRWSWICMAISIVIAIGAAVLVSIISGITAGLEYLPIIIFVIVIAFALWYLSREIK